MSRRSSRIVLVLSVLGVIAALGVFALQLQSSQRQAHDDVVERFVDRARVSASLTQSVFTASSASGRQNNARNYGSRRIAREKLADAQRRGNLAYLVVLDDEGRPIAASPGTEPATLEALRRKPGHLAKVLAGGGYALSGVIESGRGRTALEFAQPFNTRYGQRVLVSGFSPELIYAFLGGYLNQVPSVEGGQAYVLDDAGRVVGSPAADLRPGQRLDEAELLTAASETAHGRYGSGRYFATAQVPDTPWRVVVSAGEAELFAGVRGARKWVPWAIFAAFAAAALVALLMLRRVVDTSAALAVKNREIAEANASLERRAAELARSNEELEQFASIASHDLREPLRKVQTFSERLIASEADGLSERGRDYLNRSSAAAGRMQELIDDLLRFSRVRTHGKPFVPVDLATVVREVVDDLGAVVEESDARIDIGDLPTVLADPFQMRQLFQNLVSNALKFAREGEPPEVRISARLCGDTAKIDVTDRGIGFEPQYTERIFKVFERLHGRGKYPGTGIGLPLCRKIAERHGGQVSALGIPGAGATFTVTVPLAAVERVEQISHAVQTREESEHVGA